MEKENLIYVEEVMKHPRIVSMVERKSAELVNQMLDVTCFEYECYVDIGRNLLAKDEHKSVENLAIYHIRRKAAKYLRRSNYKNPDSFEELAFQNDEGSEVDFEIEDILANVERLLEEREEEKEMTALLAKGDRRKKLVITAWMNGQTNDLELSDTLASVLGGQAESHRKFIQRYRNGIKKTMPVAI